MYSVISPTVLASPIYKRSDLYSTISRFVVQFPQFEVHQLTALPAIDVQGAMNGVAPPISIVPGQYDIQHHIQLPVTCGRCPASHPSHISLYLELASHTTQPAPHRTDKIRDSIALNLSILRCSGLDRTVSIAVIWPAHDRDVLVPVPACISPLGR